MVRAWYHEGLDENLGREDPSPGSNAQFLDVDAVCKETALVLHRVDVDHWATDAVLKSVRDDLNCQYDDLLELNTGPDIDAYYKTAGNKYLQEHLHPEEELRLMIDGTGFFDIRDLKDRWIRVEVGKGDLVTLPEGAYHRFTIPPKEDATLRRFFVNPTLWKAYYRPADDHPSRIKYLRRMSGS